MDTVMYVDGRKDDRDRKRLIKAGKILLWAVMIGISVFLASRSLIMM